MRPRVDSEEKLIRYLLGQLSEDEMARLEEIYFTDDERYDELEVVEYELIDRYVEGLLSARDRQRFEDFFLCTPARQRKLRFARALRETVAKRSRERRGRPGRFLSPRLWMHALVATRLRAVVSIIIILGIGIGAWRLFIYQSPERQVIAALSKAYHNQRLNEARVSELSYAPLPNDRGNAPNDVEVSERNRAELIALNEAHDHPGWVAYHSLGRVYFSEHKLDEAIAEFRRAIAINPDHARLQSDLGAALLEKARSNSNQAEKAVGLAESLTHLDKALELNGSLLEALFNRALCHEYLSLWKRAEADWQQYLDHDSSSQWAAEAREHLKGVQEKVSAQTKEQLFDNFFSAYQANDSQAAWEALKQGRARTGNIIVEKAIDDFLALAAKGDTASAGSRLELAAYAGRLEHDNVNDQFTNDLTQFYRRTSAAQKRLLAQARGFMKAANESYLQTEYERAAELYSTAKGLFKQTGDACEMAFADSRIGNCYLRIPNADKSISIFESLNRIFDQKQYRWLLAQSLNAMADAKTSKTEFSQTLDYARQSFDLSRDIQDPSGMLRNMQLYVTVQQQLGDYRDSLGHVLRAFDLASTFSPEAYERWPFYYQAAFDYYLLDCPAVALDFQREALRLALESGIPLLKARSYAHIALMFQKTKDYNEAVKYGELALQEARNISGEKSRTNLVANASLNLGHLYRESGNFSRALAYYDQAIELHQQLHLEIYNFEAHRGKLLALVALGDQPTVKEEIEAAIRLIEQYRPKISEESNRNKFFDLAQSIYDIAIDFSYSQLKDAAGAFNYAEASRARSLLDLVSTSPQIIHSEGELDMRFPFVTPPSDLSSIQQRMPEGSRIVQYAALADKIIVWVVFKDHIESAEQAIANDELNKSARQWIDLILNSPEEGDEAIRAKAVELYKILISPIESFINGADDLFIVPDKVLNYLPFGALIAPGTGHYFIEDHLFQLSPSSSIFVSCTDIARKKAGLRNEKVLCIGNPTFDRGKFPSLPDLRSAETEATRVSKIYDSPEALLGPEARVEQVKARMPEADVIHFAGHYVVDEHSPMASGMLLAKEPMQSAPGPESNGCLSSAEIYASSLPRMRVAVLSACQTGIERLFNGEGAMSAARSFIKAGVPVIVASLWAVESTYTTGLMISFHRYRKQGPLTTAKALRQAQLDMLASPDPGNHQPRYWAPFVIIGGYAEF